MTVRRQIAGFVPAFMATNIWMNLIYAVTATPAGVLSDRIGRVKLLSCGLGALFVADLTLAFVPGLGGVFVGIGLWGLHLGFSQGLLSALVADTAPADLRGTAFGLFNLVSGGGTAGRERSGRSAMAILWGNVDIHRRRGLFGDRGPHHKSWNTTINELEQTAQAHSDAVLILDETSLAGNDEKERAITVLSGAFRLSEVTKKRRYNEPEAPAWRFYFLSTSNFTLDELADQGGVPIGNQHRGRLVDIVLPPGPGTFGIYQDLHGFSDGAALTDAIKAQCRSVFGTPGYRLVRKLYQKKRSRATAKKFVSAQRTYYINCIRQEAKSMGLKPLERATARFATVYAAGCLAIKYGIFLWSRKELLKAVLSCQFDGLVQAHGKIDHVSDLRQRLIAHFVRHRRELFSLNGARPSAKDHEFGSVPGYAHKHNGVDWLYLTSEQLKIVIGTGKAARRLKKRLVEEHLMASTGQRALVQRPIFRGKGNKGYRWVHAFHASLLANSTDAPRRRALIKNT